LDLLYSICRVREFTGFYPRHVSLVSWGFKEERFDFPRRAILWSAHRFTYVGANNPPDLAQAMDAEARNRTACGADPYSSSPASRAKRDARNPFRRTPGYLLQCPELTGLMAHEGPELYSGALPWRS